MISFVTSPACRRLAALLLSFVLAGCAQPPRQPTDGSTPTQRWIGRLALKVESDPPQSFFSGFELSGRADRGELFLYSPLGNTVSSLSWTASHALLKEGSRQRYFASLDELSIEATGAAIPLGALFQWLNGQEAQADGWQADLTQLEQGRLTAHRLHPAPATELRLILDR